MRKARIVTWFGSAWLGWQCIATLVFHVNQNPTTRIKQEETLLNSLRTTSKTTPINATISNTTLSPPHRKKQCTCLDVNSRCCLRSILVVHKMGLTAMQQVRDLYGMRGILMKEIANHKSIGKGFRSLSQPEIPYDYRTVVLTRNWYDSLISGYLYHKSGRECWLDWYGRQNDTQAECCWLQNNTAEDWTVRIASFRSDNNESPPLPPSRNRNLCEYLATESELNGLRAYVEWALDMYLVPLVKFATRRKQQENGDIQKTFFVCYQDLFENIDKTKNQSTTHNADALYNLYRFLYPSKKKIKLTMVNNNTKFAPPDETVIRGHATSRDAMVRARLRSLILKFDQEFFHNAIANGNAEFQCRVEDYTTGF